MLCARPILSIVLTLCSVFSCSRVMLPRTRHLRPTLSTLSRETERIVGALASSMFPLRRAALQSRIHGQVYTIAAVIAPYCNSGR
ncbi:hypothetical protein C8Q73DRAFT_698440, partial [Cubamyces lactineus]